MSGRETTPSRRGGVREGGGNFQEGAQDQQPHTQGRSRHIYSKVLVDLENVQLVIKPLKYVLSA